tara:strand:+ start:493 stop:885 length:393 start_codon:yes stop_codon:yes gene_type:complete
MAIVLPVYSPTTFLPVATTGGGDEGTAVQLKHTSGATDTITRGAFVGLSLHLTNYGSSTETMTVRVYRKSDKTDLILEVDVSFTSANDRAYVQPDLPIPFFNGIWATLEDDGSLNRTVNMKPDVLGIAGS